MSHKLDLELLMERLDSSNLMESEKIELVRRYRQQQSGIYLVASVRAAGRAVRFIYNQVVNHRAVQQVFSSPLMRAKH